MESKRPVSLAKCRIFDEFLLVYKWRSFDRSSSFRCDSTIERLGMCNIFHQFTVGERVLVIIASWTVG